MAEGREGGRRAGRGVFEDGRIGVWAAWEDTCGRTAASEDDRLFLSFLSILLAEGVSLSDGRFFALPPSALDQLHFTKALGQTAP